MSLTITSEDGRLQARFLPELGMVCASVEVDDAERIDLRRGPDAYREQGKTFGIPLLYPWGNRLAARDFTVADTQLRLPEPGTETGIDEHGLPHHGVQPRLMRWVAGTDGSGCVEATLDWRSEELLAIFPFAHSVAYGATAGPGAELHISVTVRADGEDRVPVAFGLHPYLQLPAGGRSATEIELPASERLLVDDRGLPTGAREPLSPATVPLDRPGGWDDGLVLSGATRAGAEPQNEDGTAAVFAAVAPGGQVTVELLQGFTHGQIFSPDGAQFVCFEPMSAPTNALVSGDGLRILAPGDALKASFRIAWS
jgi:galactose mutarotase-like enzyme